MSNKTQNTTGNHTVIPLIFFSLAGAYGLYEAQEMSDFGAIFPQLASSIIILAALIHLYAHIRRQITVHADGQAVLRPLALLATLLGWAILLPVLGFIPTSLLGAGLIWAIATQTAKSLKTCILEASSLILLIFATAFIFGRLLMVPLP